MNAIAQKSSLSGRITVPASKSHTIRALLLAALAEGTSRVRNPLPSADCLSTAAALPLVGAEIDLNFSESAPGSEWLVRGAGRSLRVPDDVVDVGNSGSLLYFLAPICATLGGASVFTGDESIRGRPVAHLVDSLNQISAERSFVTRPGANGCPMVVRGPIRSGVVRTEGSVSSQYVSGLMMAGALVEGGIRIELSDPKETPYLTMTKSWLDRVGVESSISGDFRRIEVKGRAEIRAFDATIPSDWEGVAFPLVAALVSEGSEVVIEHIDGSGTQGDDAVVEILRSVGADIEWDREAETLTVRSSRLSAESLPGGTLRVAMSPFPDAVCALAVAACFIEGTTVLEDAAVCRRKETDRLRALTEELSALGADVEEGADFLTIRGHSPRLADGSPNPEFRLHGGIAESRRDHRLAMSFACLGLGLRAGGRVIVRNAECCSVSFPRFFESMNTLGAGFSSEG